ncbi:MAG: cystine ABC transporter substrate-binding protein [Pseudomonas sp.]|uniref:cystine ABC transporter substrate-binding protein n=1 Tax=Pseudomonas sp. TaxID=306 RepID=UPI0027287EAB|nr:cystine ABC transporter substrate-binding protein [Pseudomonas sp.]MDO9618728.1 cystine ABC transporter substrate-binding protein [Pseudomonas sp.]MDP2445887.1 cystine ABC transporter substrate-binding protein [Pseudomonas sp.]MDZ4333617.1 cystine ABC transporter substrate-binding protein [Pseudomonas sp.]
MQLSLLRRQFAAVGFGLALAAGWAGHSVAADDLLLQIQQRGAINVGLEGTYPPFNFQDESGKLTGFEVEFAQALAKELGVKAEFQPTKWDGILAALESSRLDVVVNQVTISEERKKKYDFSAPYTVSGIQVLTRKGQQGQFSKPADLSGKKVGVVLGTNYEQWLKDNVPGADIRTYDDDATRNQDVRVGRIDAILGDRLAAFELIAKTGDSLAVAGEPFAPQQAGIALRKGNPELLAAIDKAIAKLRADGTLAAISQKWFKADVTQ